MQVSPHRTKTHAFLRNMVQHGPAGSHQFRAKSLHLLGLIQQLLLQLLHLQMPKNIIKKVKNKLLTLFLYLARLS